MFILDLYISLMTKYILENDEEAGQRADELSYDFEHHEMEYCYSRIPLKNLGALKTTS